MQPLAQSLPSAHLAAPKRITLFGATGTIGENTLDIIRQAPDHFQLFAASGHNNAQAMQRIIREFHPEYVTMTDAEALAALKASDAACLTTILDAKDALSTIAHMPCDMQMHAIVGAAGLAPLHAAILHGQAIALANKESLICAGHVLMPMLRQKNLPLFPVDSEHSSIFQLLEGKAPETVKRITLTASGGPFLTRPLENFASITPEDAVKHPNWVMGAKISVDSATMANKGLELMEAHYLFNSHADALDAVIHPESIIHGLIEMEDGSLFAHLSAPDMRTPIAYALHDGNYARHNAPKLDITTLGALHFHPVDAARYPLFALSKQALKTGPAAMIAFNAANEIAVEAFLQKRIAFNQISHLVETCLNAPHAALRASEIADMPSIFAYNQTCRDAAQHELIALC